MADESFIGIDLGGTHVRVGVVNDKGVGEILSTRVLADGTKEQVLNQIYELIEKANVDGTDAIGIGVPSVVDVERGIVYSVQNIPSWDEVPLKDLLETRYSRPVSVNNDANCFAMGEKYFGKGVGAKSLIGLISGTGFGAGVIVNGHLHAGANCGAGEFGMIPYRDGIYEDYCCGQFFELKKGVSGEQLFERAQQGDQVALQIFAEFGEHLGNGIKAILYAYDPQLIVLGGSVRKSFEFFEESMWATVKDFGFPESIKGLRIEVSELDNIAILGAAALCYENERFSFEST